MAEILIGSKKVVDLKVTELKEELGKRNLAKTGKKSALVKRLFEAILVEQLQSKMDEDGEEQPSPSPTPSAPENDTMEEELQKYMDSAGSLPSQAAPHASDSMALDDSVEAELEEDKEDEMEEERVMPSEFVLGFGDSNDNGEHFDEEMDLDTPPDISVELGQEEEATEEPEQEEQAGEEETENQEEEKEEGDDSGHADSISGVQIESYQPEEDLIYEGDVDSEAPAVVDIQVHPEVTTEDVNDEVQVHDFEAELDKKIKQTKSSSSSDKARSAEKSDSKSGKKASSSEKDGRSAVGGSDSSSSSVWVSGLAAAVSASDLKTLFTQFGQVLSAKVVARARFKNQRYGYITLAAPEQARKSCVELNKTELKGHKITVEIARSTPLVNSPKQEPKKDGASSKKSGSSSSGSKDKDSKKPGRSSSSDKGSDRERHSSSKSSHDASKSSSQSSPRSSSSTRRRIISIDRNGQRELVRVRRSEEGLSSRRRSRSRSPIRDRRLSDGHGPRGRIVSRLSPPIRSYYRSDMMRREEERREIAEQSIHNRLGERVLDTRTMEMRLAEQRQKLLQEQERERIRERDLLRRQMEVEHRRREDQLAEQLNQMRQREAHGRQLFERQRREAEAQQRMVEERERQIRDRERQVKEAEMRERERLAALEKQRDKEFREKERRIREEFEKELKEKERILRQQEKELRERERKIREEQERQAKLLEEERERQRRIEEQRRIREEQERKEQERQRLREQEELKKMKEEQERAAERAKRAFTSQYRMDNVKRMPSAPGGSGSPDSSSVFGRLGGRDSAGSGSRSGGVVKLETAISPNLTYRRYEATSGHATRAQTSPYTPSQQARQKEPPSSNLSTYGAVGYPLSSRASSHSGHASQQFGSSKSSSNPYGQVGSYFGDDSNKQAKEAKITSEFIAIASKALSQIAATSQVPGTAGHSNPYSQIPQNSSSMYGSPGSQMQSSHSAPVGYPRPPIPSAVSGMSRQPASSASRGFPPHKIPSDQMRYGRRLNPRAPPKKGMY